uniref:Uncharacterized protein n=1 Tax=Vitis vinifera TaxID=29760 RepID=F6HVV9_VITVI
MPRRTVKIFPRSESL